MVFGGHGAELIGRQYVRTGNQAEILRLHAMVQKSLFCTDGTVADGDAFDVDLGFEADLAAMTTAFVVVHVHPAFECSVDVA